MNFKQIPYELSLWKRHPGRIVEFIIDKDLKIKGEQSVTQEAIDSLEEIRVKGYGENSYEAEINLMSNFSQQEFEISIPNNNLFEEKNLFFNLVNMESKEETGEVLSYLLRDDFNLTKNWGFLLFESERREETISKSSELDEEGSWKCLDFNYNPLNRDESFNTDEFFDNRRKTTINSIDCSIYSPVYIEHKNSNTYYLPIKTFLYEYKYEDYDAEGAEGSSKSFYKVVYGILFYLPEIKALLKSDEAYLKISKDKLGNSLSSFSFQCFDTPEDLGADYLTSGANGNIERDFALVNFSSKDKLKKNNSACTTNTYFIFDFGQANLTSPCYFQDYNNCLLIGYKVTPPSLEKSLILSSNNSSYHLQAQNIHFIPNMDSSMQLTFDLPAWGYAPNGEYEESIFTKETQEEDLIRLRFKDDWYDFIIKKIEEKHEGEIIKYSYTCVSDIQEELGRKGYGITFDEFDGNGNIDELGKKILENSGWSYIPNKEEFQEKVKQYETDEVTGWFKFDDEGRPIETEEIKKYPITVYNEELEKYVTKYKGEAKENEDDTEAIETDFYGYQSTELVDAFTCREMITNGDIFTNAQGWVAGKGVENITAFVNQYGDENNPFYAFRLKMKRKEAEERKYIEFSNTYFKNSKEGLVGNYFLYIYLDTRFHSKDLLKPTQFAFLYATKDGKEHTIFTTSTKEDLSLSDINGKCISVRLPTEISEFTLKFRLYNEAAWINSEGKTPNDFYVAKISLFPTIEKSKDSKYVLPRGRIYNMVNSNNGTEYGVNTYKEAIPYDQAVVFVDTEHTYYLPESYVFEDSYITESMKYFILDENGKVKEIFPVASTEEELEKLIQKGSIKIRTHTSSKSNCLNNIYALASLFEGYPRFYSSRDKNGGIIISEKLVGNNLNGEAQEVILREEKYLKFEVTPGTRRDFGFVYGKNLKNINRTRSSEEIITKMFAEDVNNEALSRGKVSIAWAEDNPSKESYLYDLSYYAEKGEFTYSSLFMDLYDKSVDSIGYYPILEKINTSLEPIYLKIEQLQDTLSNLNAHGFYLDSAITAAEQEVEDAKTEISKNLDKQGNASTQIEKNIYQGYIDDATKIQRAYENELKSLYKQKDQNELFIINTNKDIEQCNIKAEGLFEQKRQLIALFEAKYGPYIKEGTWAGEQYTSNNAYYNDAKQVLTSASRPKVEYNIDVLDLRAVEGYEFLDFYVGDTVYVEDTEIFGYDSNGRPKRVDFIISEIDFNLSKPIETSLTVQSYRTPFEQFFSKTYSTITATDER